MEAFAQFKTNDNKLVPIAIIRNGKFHFIQLPEHSRIHWNYIWDFERKYNATVSVNAGGHSFNVKFN